MKKYITILAALGLFTAIEASRASSHKHTEIIDIPTAISFSKDVRVSFLQTSKEANKGFTFSELPLDLQKSIVINLDGESAINFSGASVGCFNLVALRNSVTYSWIKIIRERINARLYSVSETNRSKVRTVIFNYPIIISDEQFVNITKRFWSIKKVITYGDDGAQRILTPPNYRWEDCEQRRREYEHHWEMVFMDETIPIREAMTRYDYDYTYVASDNSDSE